MSGRTAADVAERRGLLRVAARLQPDERPQHQLYDGYFALPQERLLIARYVEGFDSLEALVKSMQA